MWTVYRIEAFNEDIAAANEYTLIGAIEEVPLPVRAFILILTELAGLWDVCKTVSVPAGVKT